MSFADHLQRFFPDATQAQIAPRRPAIEELLPGFRVRRLAPAQPGAPWIYVTDGAAQPVAPGGDGAEYVIAAPADAPVLVELLAALASVSTDPARRLGVGSVIALGRPWIPGAGAEHLLVLPPYPFGAGFERCELADRTVIVLWLLPIAAAEARFVRAHGYEAFEQLMRREDIKVTDPARPSLV